MTKRVRLHQEEKSGSSSATVTLTLKDGRVLKERVEQIKAPPAWPPTGADFYVKFSLLPRHCPKPKMDEIFERLQNIEKESNFDWLKV